MTPSPDSRRVFINFGRQREMLFSFNLFFFLN